MLAHGQQMASHVQPGFVSNTLWRTMTATDIQDRGSKYSALISREALLGLAYTFIFYAME